MGHSVVALDINNKSDQAFSSLENQSLPCEVTGQRGLDLFCNRHQN